MCFYKNDLLSKKKQGKKIQSVDGKTIIKILEQHGFNCIRIKGSHHIMSKEVKKCTVPVHVKHDIKIGTLKDIEKRSEVKLK